MRARRRALLAESDRDGVVDTRKEEYLREWRKWRKQVKQVYSVMNGMRCAFGLPRLPRTLEGGWGDSEAWGDAVLENLYGARPGASKASKGMRETASRALGLKEQRDRELHADYEELLASYGSDPDVYDPDVRAALIEMLLDVREVVKHDEESVGLLACADLMRADMQGVPDVSGGAPLGDLWYEGNYPWSRTNWELRDGVMVCWAMGRGDIHRPLTQSEPVHVLYARHHGWEVPAFVNRGNGEGWTDRHHAEAIDLALRMVELNIVPPPVSRRGRPPVYAVVLDALGRRGVVSCASWAGRQKLDESIEYALDHQYTQRVHEYVDSGAKGN